jgi:uncharacterized protein YbjT (DUF2867 family)
MSEFTEEEMIITRRKVLVGGATGKQGNAVANLLLERGHDVVAYVRSTESPQAVALAAKGAKLLVGDLADRETLERAIAGVDAMFSITVPFSKGGVQEEIEQGKVMADVAAAQHKHLVYSSIAGGQRRPTDLSVEHASSKQLIEAYMATKDLALTTIAPVYIMENLLNFDFNGLRYDTYAQPLSPRRKIDQVTVLDIAGMAVYALEHPEELIGKRVEVASESVNGEAIVRTLSEVIGRPIRYVQVPIEQIRTMAGDEIAKMYQRFEDEPYYTDIAALQAQYPGVKWHTFRQWVETLDWKNLLPR